MFPRSPPEDRGFGKQPGRCRDERRHTALADHIAELDERRPRREAAGSVPRKDDRHERSGKRADRERDPSRYADAREPNGDDADRDEPKRLLERQEKERQEPDG